MHVVWDRERNVKNEKKKITHAIVLSSDQII